MKIPKKVNAVWDWVSPRRVPLTVYGTWAVLLLAGVFTKVSGALWAAAAGLMVGAVVGYGLRTASEVHAREENQRLRAEVAGLRTKAVPPVDTSASVETQKIWPLRGDR